jgi:hypothetical protein
MLQLTVGRDVRRVMRTALNKWWRSFGYNYVLVVIRAKLHEVTTHM